MRWAVIGSGSAAAAEEAARTRGLDPVMAAGKSDLLSPRRLRRRMKELGVDAVAVHTPSWRHELNPQLYELALALSPGSTKCVLDGETGALIPFGRSRLARRLGSLPLQGAAGVALSAGEAARLVAPRTPKAIRSRPSGRNVLAIWIGGPEAAVGGSMTHISGILAAMRRAGCSVTLLGFEPLPEQLAASIDHFEPLRPLRPSERLSEEIVGLALNRLVRRAGPGVIERARPDLIYQRHRPFFTAGADLANRHGLPLVLEWNAAETWTRANWDHRLAPGRIFDPVLAGMEKRAVRAAELIVAVSSEAAAMAHDAGAPEERTLVVPNAVDVSLVPQARDEESPAEGALLGWIGTYGPWHGAEVLIRALPLLPNDVRAMMIGEGRERDGCRALAESLGVEGRVEWTGSLPHREALERLAAAQILVSPHIPLGPQQPFFGSPTKIFEYMAIGRPIVASRLGQLAEVLDDQRTALLVTPGDHAELAQAIRDVLARPDRGRALGREARREAEARHTWDHRAASILERLRATPGAVK